MRASENPLKMIVKMLTHMHKRCTLGGVGTFAKVKVLEKKESFFGVLRTLGWLLEWNTALIHCDLDQVVMLVVFPSE